MIQNNNSKSNIWSQKGASLSDKSARKEFSLTQDEIIKAINDGKIEYMVSSIYGNPYFRLVRSDVEKCVAEKYGEDFINEKKFKEELTDIESELRRLESEIRSLQQRKTELTKNLEQIQSKKTNHNQS